MPFRDRMKKPDQNVNRWEGVGNIPDGRNQTNINLHKEYNLPPQI